MPLIQSSFELFQQRFTRNHKGNLSAIIEGERITIFARNGEYTICVADDSGGPRYGNGYETEQDALHTLFMYFDDLRCVSDWLLNDEPETHKSKQRKRKPQMSRAELLRYYSAI